MIFFTATQGGGAPETHFSTATQRGGVLKIFFLRQDKGVLNEPFHQLPVAVLEPHGPSAAPVNGGPRGLAASLKRRGRIAPRPAHGIGIVPTPPGVPAVGQTAAVGTGHRARPIRLPPPHCPPFSPVRTSARSFSFPPFAGAVEGPTAVTVADTRSSQYFTKAKPS